MLKSLKFEIGGKEIDLTENEARELLGELKRVLEAAPVYVPSVWPAVPWHRDYTTWTDEGRTTADGTIIHVN